MSTHLSHSGFTLVELIAAMAIMSVLLLAMSSALVIASHALPSESRPATRVLRGSAALQLLADELAEAIAITERGTRALAFTIADRNGDGAPERIRYAWSGSPGAPVTRSYNGATPVTVVNDAYAFDLAYVLRTETETYSGAIVESAEQVWSSFNNMSATSDFQIKKKEWIAQLVRPTLPANAVSWCVTRAKLLLCTKGPTDGRIDVQVRPADASDLPTASVLDYQRFAENSLYWFYAWKDITLSNRVALAPGARACIAVVASNNKDDSAQVLYNGNTGNGFIETSNAENGWKVNSGKGVHHYIYGTYKAPGPNQTATRRFVNAVRLDLQVGAEAAGAVHTSVRTANDPELLRANWELTAGQSPGLDRNGDGQIDFDTATAFVMNPDLLMDGSTSWTIPVTGTVVTTQPPNDFSDLITVNARFRDLVTSDAQPAMICVNADWVDAVNAQIFAGLTLKASGTQTLLVTAQDASGDVAALLLDDTLPVTLIDLRLLVDPALNSVNVRVNGVDRGTYTYTTRSRSVLTRYVQFAPWASVGAEFDQVSIRVGDRTP